jgi:hypothetical protein
MTDIIRDALREYLKRIGIKLEEKLITKMLSTRGTLDSEEFERRVREVKEALSECKVSSV